MFAKLNVTSIFVKAQDSEEWNTLSTLRIDQHIFALAVVLAGKALLAPIAMPKVAGIGFRMFAFAVLMLSPLAWLA